MSWSAQDAIDRLEADGFGDGDMLSHDWIRFALDFNPQEHNDFVLLERMDSFRKALLEEYKIALQNVRGEGYRIVPPSQQAEFAAREASRYIEKGMNKADALLTHTRRDQLTQDEAKRHTDTEVRIAGLRGVMNKGKRDVFALFAPSK